MQIVPYVGETVVSSDTVTIRVNPADRDRADDLVLRTSTITVVKDERTYAAAREAAGYLKSMLNEIADSERGAKRHFQAVVNSIGQLAKDIGTTVKSEHERILRMCSAYVARIEAEEAERKAKLRAAQAEAEAKITEARKAVAVAKKNEVALAQLNLARAELHREMTNTAAELAEMEKTLAPGGKVAHPWKFELVDPVATIQAGAKRLLRIEVDFLACQDSVRSQLEIAPDKAPSLPGIKVSRETRVSIKATAQTS